MKILIVPFMFDHTGFGARMLDARYSAGLSQEDVGALVGCSGAHISTLERGNEPNPKIQTLLNVCNTFDFDIRDFFLLQND